MNTMANRTCSSTWTAHANTYPPGTVIAPALEIGNQISIISPISTDTEASRLATDITEIVPASSADEVQSVVDLEVHTTAPLGGLSTASITLDVADSSTPWGVVASSSGLQVCDASERGGSPVSGVFSEGALLGPLTLSHSTRTDVNVSYIP